VYYYIRFSEQVKKALIDHTMKDPTKECGGFLYGKTWRTENGVMCDIDAIYYEDRKGTHNRFCFDQIYMRNAYKAGWKMEDSSFLGTYHSHAQLPAKLSDIDRDSLIKYFGMGRIMLVYSPKYNRMVAEYVDVDKKTHKVKIITKK
jgi:proteasome lid subunit RPN8/RPN11